jgi:hypothetical protein
MGTQAGLHPNDTTRQLLKRRNQCQPLDMPPQDQLPVSIEANEMNKILTDIDADNGKVLNLFILLRTHSCFSWLFG